MKFQLAVDGTPRRSGAKEPHGVPPGRMVVGWGLSERGKNTEEVLMADKGSTKLKGAILLYRAVHTDEVAFEVDSGPE